MFSFDFKKESVIEVMLTSKKSGGIPSLLDLSYDDQYLIEGFQQTITLRDIKKNQALAKYEGH